MNSPSLDLASHLSRFSLGVRTYGKQPNTWMCLMLAFFVLCTKSYGVLVSHLGDGTAPRLEPRPILICVEGQERATSPSSLVVPRKVVCSPSRIMMGEFTLAWIATLTGCQR
ncbi:hypothetical protein DAPPUDRAFT_124189 [Daphnia pulex]|uniref:Uncharacterized protein n=1 Tax=Daphnia pulex TaxID=6669 RepID=E9I6E2_DAPPU|nr:hypothetical protein DAPPUDRAFT_124189 [Daphnia pulex]|eukprot:EFX60438.1 hypothetical protein DAPPUDRAFT_124189 [Daphnia pulex]